MRHKTVRGEPEAPLLQPWIQEGTPKVTKCHRRNETRGRGAVCGVCREGVNVWWTLVTPEVMPAELRICGAFPDFSERSLLRPGRGQRARARPRTHRGSERTRGSGEGSGVCCPSEPACCSAGVESPFMLTKPPRMSPVLVPKTKAGRRDGSPPLRPSNGLSTVCGLRWSVPTSPCAGISLVGCSQPVPQPPRPLASPHTAAGALAAHKQDTLWALPEV